MKNIVVILFACLLCLGLIACGEEEKDKFVGLWEATVRPNIPLAVQIKRDSSKNTYSVKCMIKADISSKTLTMARITSDLTAVMEDGILKMKNGITAKIDTKTGKLHLGGVAFTKADYEVELTLPPKGLYRHLSR